MRLFLQSTVLLAAVALTACTKPVAKLQGGEVVTGGQPATYLIRYERTGCMGPCPTYAAEIAADGSVYFIGGLNAFHEGEVKTHIDKKVIDEVLRQATAMKFDAMPADEYGKGMMDAPSDILTIRRKTGDKTVTCVGGECPAALKELHHYLDAEIHEAVGDGPAQPQQEIIFKPGQRTMKGNLKNANGQQLGNDTKQGEGVVTPQGSPE